MENSEYLAIVDNMSLNIGNYFLLFLGPLFILVLYNDKITGRKVI